MITNGTRLIPQMGEGLAAAGLDFLWVSLDGAFQESYRDVRLGDHLPQIIQSLEWFQASGKEKPALGIAFVLMKRNAADLPALLALCEELKVDSFFITHAEAYHESMVEEILYREEVSRGSHPPMNQAGNFGEVEVDIKALLAEEYPFKVTGSLAATTEPACPFVDRSAVVVRWDGAVSPCLPLLYGHSTFTPFWKRKSVPYHVGTIQQKTVGEHWRDLEYRSLRERLRERSFSPCVSCRDCWLSNENLQDCMGYEHPTCGGCLWLEGFIQCP